MKNKNVKQKLGENICDRQQKSWHLEIVFSLVNQNIRKHSKYNQWVKELGTSIENM